LVVAGLVSPQKPSLDRYHRRIDEMIVSVPEQARLVVRRYVRWAATRPLQQKVDTGATVTPQLVDWPLERARVTCQFTSAVAAGGARLGTISQSQLDAWVAELPSHRAAMDDDERLGLACIACRPDRTVAVRSVELVEGDRSSDGRVCGPAP
jgi:hypothetical protein